MRLLIPNKRTRMDHHRMSPINRMTRRRVESLWAYEKQTLLIEYYWRSCAVIKALKTMSLSWASWWCIVGDVYWIKIFSKRISTAQNSLMGNVKIGSMRVIPLKRSEDVTSASENSNITHGMHKEIFCMSVYVNLNIMNRAKTHVYYSLVKIIASSNVI